MRYKTLATIAISVLMPFVSNAQKADSYKVVKVQGEIQRVKTGNLLSLGDNVVSNENFDFKTTSSRAVVVNKEKGCMILSAKANNEGPQFLPSSNNMSVRAALPANPTEVMEYYYDNVFISGFDSLKIDNEALQIDDVNYFTVNYTANNNSYSEKIELKNGKLVLPATLLEKQPSKITICYNDEYGVNGQTEFTPVYADSETLRDEIAVIFSTIKGKRNAKVSASTSFVNDFYGKTTDEAMDAWIKSNLKY